MYDFINEFMTDAAGASITTETIQLTLMEMKNKFTPKNKARIATICALMFGRGIANDKVYTFKVIKVPVTLDTNDVTELYKEQYCVGKV